MFNVKCAVCIWKYDLFSVLSSVFSVLCAVCSVQFEEFSVLDLEFSVKCLVQQREGRGWSVGGLLSITGYSRDWWNCRNYTLLLYQELNSTVLHDTAVLNRTMLHCTEMDNTIFTSLHYKTHFTTLQCTSLNLAEIWNAQPYMPLFSVMPYINAHIACYSTVLSIADAIHCRCSCAK